MGVPVGADDGRCVGTYRPTRMNLYPRLARKNAGCLTVVGADDGAAVGTDDGKFDGA